MNYIKITKNDIANGEGLRVVLWISGCDLKCPGCHNPDTWDYCAGKYFDNEAKEELFDALSKSWCKGITFSGGHPLDIRNIIDVSNLILEIREKFPDKDIWLYTGYTFETIYNLSDINTVIESNEVNNLTDSNIINSYCHKIINNIDVLVDGPYIENQRNISLKFRGSNNQRLIDVKETLEKRKIILYE